MKLTFPELLISLYRYLYSSGIFSFYFKVISHSGVLMLNSFSFNLKKFLISPLFLKDTFSEYKILG